MIIFTPFLSQVHLYSTLVDDVLRLIAHHLLRICSRDGAFNHLSSVPENSALLMELAPLLAAKKELGEGEGLASQLLLDQDLPMNQPMNV